MMMETDLLVTQATNPFYGKGRTKKKTAEKRKRRSEWMENEQVKRRRDERKTFDER